jgi:ABC-type anion transport system duplicated permease subunit
VRESTQDPTLPSVLKQRSVSTWATLLMSGASLGAFYCVLTVARTWLGPAAPAATQIGVELGAILLIFTGQVWNLAFSFYSSLKSIPSELREAARVYRFNGWAAAHKP